MRTTSDVTIKCSPRWQMVLLAAVGCAALVVSAGCPTPSGTQPFQPQRGQPRTILCTTGMVADVVRNVALETTKVEALMGAGVDPHLYKPSPGDARRLNAADAIFYSGLHLEGKMTELFEQLANQKPVYSVAEGMPQDQLLGEAHSPDPHVWFDVSLWSHAAEHVRAKLTALDPDHADDYARRCAAYRARLQTLHEETVSAIKELPADRRLMVTAHDAFHYWGRAYGLEVRGIQGISTDSEAGVKQINTLVQLLVERKLPAVFVETSVSDQNVKSLVEGCASHGHQLKIGGELYSDAMGTEGTPEGTYEGMIRHNTRTIVEALR